MTTVFFAFTKAGVESCLHDRHVCPVLWVNGAVLSDAEIEELRREGAAVSVFSDAHDPTSNEDIDSALSTIREHHPGLPIWVEH